ncbi:ribbon-helix-helix protein, CopG family [Thiohalobacter sp. COW1]|uniref:ribbon-helix-helix protein, CopG family n=1 Tax=Thiohalobacter sp. COW1 TaxID=2795687 RepID=UPI00351C3A07
MGYKSAEIWLPRQQYDVIDELARKSRVSRSVMMEELLSEALRHRQQHEES